MAAAATKAICPAHEVSGLVVVAVVASVAVAGPGGNPVTGFAPGE